MALPPWSLPGLPITLGALLSACPANVTWVGSLRVPNQLDPRLLLVLAFLVSFETGYEKVRQIDRCAYWSFDSCERETNFLSFLGFVGWGVSDLRGLDRESKLVIYIDSSGLDSTDSSTVAPEPAVQRCRALRSTAPLLPLRPTPATTRSCC